MDNFFTNEKNARTPVGGALIATVYDPIQTAVIKGLLESEKIPFLIRERGTGSSLSIIMGTNYLGTDIFVAESCYDRATQLIEPLFSQNNDSEDSLDNEDNITDDNIAEDNITEDNIADDNITDDNIADEDIDIETEPLRRRLVNFIMASARKSSQKKKDRKAKKDKENNEDN